MDLLLGKCLLRSHSAVFSITKATFFFFEELDQAISVSRTCF